MLDLIPERDKDIFPKLLFMPTGGVDTTRENIEGWFQAGVSAGIGSKLISTQLMTDKDYSNRIGNKKDIGPHSTIKNK
jgi:2-dehydro-3-deoxyphosphogluconate aldolase/(4S)-4-hydroxy-2-oxoglutarate aldolase